MVVNRGATPTAQETFGQMAKEAGLRGRVFLTLGILLLVRLGIYIPIPGIDRAAFAEQLASNDFLGFVNIFTGGGISALGVFMLGILPFINASIIIQLLTSAVPTLENLQKNEGEAGRRQISQYTRYLTLMWAIIQGVGISVWVFEFAQPGTSQLSFTFETTLALTAGSMFVMWASELITERGIGNGASLLIFVNIVATLPSALADTIDLARADRGSIGGIIALAAVLIAMIVCIVYVQEGTRRIPIVSAKRQVGRRLYREQKNYLPLRLNQGGVMPIIFASAVLILPASLANFSSNLTIQRISGFLAPGTWAYIALYLVMILFFSFFYASLIINPVDLAQNLKKMGSSIPGIRPGRATSEYIEGVLNRLTFLGAIFLGAVAIIPTIVERATGVTTFQGLGATSLLILVGVAIDTSKQIQTYVISQRYEGMVKQ
ncbi:preprotein translocase subunit SecY [Synechococcus sp. PCC 7336]|uniref:preprotein translocase subunit SecY n=1 Tax=Synechococcus sp. PCC 7336 TaxID=195250 RepID=UPI00034A0EF2|nr:preprotein translocase subunit SecY [Synechococcus sp. PCC 7336]